MNYAQAKQLAQKMFGPTARVERGKTKEGTWTWAILVRVRGEWSVAGNGGTFDQMIRDAAEKVTAAQKSFKAVKTAMPAADAAAEVLPVSGTNEVPVELITEAKTYSVEEFAKLRTRGHAIGCPGHPCACEWDAEDRLIVPESKS